MTKDLYIKYLNNQCTAEELEEVVQWINSWALDETFKQWGFQSWKSIHEGSFSGDDEKFSVLFDKIQNRIDQKTEKEIKAHGKRTRLVTWMTRAAAILFFPMLLFFMYTILDKDALPVEYAQFAVDSLEVISPIGSRTVLQLSDGTEVHLNSGSKLKYPQTFTGDIRGVTLEGEGFFDVAHNPEIPFVVKTGKIDVKALGTAFNVLAYSDDDVIETTLVKGKLVLEKNLPRGQKRSLGVMVPCQHVAFNVKTCDCSSTKGDVEKYIAWKDGKMVFDDTPLTEIARQLERKYNVVIEVQDDIKDYEYTVTFLDEPLLQILELMTIATPVSYKALPRKKMPDGTFSKQKITIKRKDE